METSEKLDFDTMKRQVASKLTSRLLWVMRALSAAGIFNGRYADRAARAFWVAQSDL